MKSAPLETLSRLLTVGAVAFLCLFTGPPTPASGQSSQPTARQNPDERVELIMAGLPPAGSAAYASIRALAGDATGQVLELTKCEVWAVRRKHIEVLKREAAKQGVTVSEVGADWNNMFTHINKSDAMADKAKSMMDTAMQSAATAGVTMMGARAANEVEYALTKGMHDKDASNQPMRVKIAVNANSSITAVRRSVEIRGNRCIWRGVVEGTEAPVTLMWWANGRITGTIHRGDRIYQLKQMDKGVIGIVETMVDRMPDDHPRMTPERMQQMKKRFDKGLTRGDASAVRPKRGETQNQQDDANDAAPPKPPGIQTAVVDSDVLASSRDSRPEKQGQALPEVVIDVMVAYTSKAARHYSDIKLDLVELAVEDTNKSFRDSGIPNVEVRLVHIHKTDYDEAGAEHFDHVWRMVDLGDGYLEELPALRNKYKADVVLLVVDDAKGCGLATRVAADASEAYAVVHHECAATTYSFAHEIGHLIGARHDRLLDMSSGPFPYGHGYIEPEHKWRTVMSYKRGCNGCPRLPIWSTPASVVKGRPAGDEMQNNARVIRENSERVSLFR